MSQRSAGVCTHSTRANAFPAIFFMNSFPSLSSKEDESKKQILTQKIWLLPSSFWLLSSCSGKIIGSLKRLLTCPNLALIIWMFLKNNFHSKILVYENIFCYWHFWITSLLEIRYFLKVCPIFVTLEVERNKQNIMPLKTRPLHKWVQCTITYSICGEEGFQGKFCVYFTLGNVHRLSLIWGGCFWPPS